MKRSIVCPSNDGFTLLQSWLPRGVVNTSWFVTCHGMWDATDCTWRTIKRFKAPTLLIHNAYCVYPDLVSDQIGSAESILEAHYAKHCEVRIAVPTLEVMLFETPEIIDAVFGERATETVRVMGIYDPVRAIQIAGTTMARITERLDTATIDMLRATPTGKYILEGIAELDARNPTCTCIKH